jgi:hypothetical protein
MSAAKFCHDKSLLGRGIPPLLLQFRKNLAAKANKLGSLNSPVGQELLFGSPCRCFTDHRGRAV